MFERIFDIEMNAGRLPEPPEALRRPGVKMSIQVMGPLAQAQKRLFKTQGILQSMEILEPMAKVFPNINDWIDEEILARELLQEYGMPEKIIRKPQQVAAKRAALMKQAMAAQSIENMKGLSESAKNLATPVPPGSPLEQAMQNPTTRKLIGGGA
jgi:hypothetical protein